MRLGMALLFKFRSGGHEESWSERRALRACH
jgi:hypothetical protein